MSVAGILSSSLFGVQGLGAPSKSGKSPGVSQFQQQLQQLGKDLKSGNLSTAQADFARLQQAKSSTSSISSGSASNAGQTPGLSGTVSNPDTLSASSITTNAAAQLIQQMGQALQTGNISAAQQAYSSLGSPLVAM